MQKDKKILKPTSNHLQISNKKDVKFYIFLSKIFLTEFPTVELHSLGEAISTCVRVAENLERFGYAHIKKIEQFTYSFPENEENANRERGGKKVKLVVTLEKSNNFHEMTTNLKQ